MPAGHRLARRRSVALSDLHDEALVVPPPGRPHRRNLERALRSARVRWGVGVETEGWQAMLRFVVLGVGVAVVNGCVDAPAGVVVRPVVDLPPVTYTALYRAGALDDPRVAAVLDAVRASAP
jgi:DNA-binding transcriptional LysR family regulator